MLHKIATGLVATVLLLVVLIAVVPAPKTAHRLSQTPSVTLPSVAPNPTQTVLTELGPGAGERFCSLYTRGLQSGLTRIQLFVAFSTGYWKVIGSTQPGTSPGAVFTVLARQCGH